MRHGRSAHVQAGWLDAAGFRAWREAYEAAGLHETEHAPASLQALVAQADRLLSSDAPRANFSARLLAPAREPLVSPLLRELDLEGPRLGGLRLPLRAWAVAVGGRALLLTLQGRYPSPVEATRIEEAAAWLDRLADEHGLIVAVTHASFRRCLARRLLRLGWRAEPGDRSTRHWSAWHLTRRALRRSTDESTNRRDSGTSTTSEGP